MRAYYNETWDAPYARLQASGISLTKEFQKEEILFLSGLICEHHPKKLLEIGVGAGNSTTVSALAIDMLGLHTKMYSADILERFYRDSSKMTGYLLGEAKGLFLQPIDHTFCFGLIPQFLPQIGSDIDLLLLDTTHSLPGEILDFLCCLPYLRNGCVVVLHDVIYSHTSGNKLGIATKVLFDTVSAEKKYFAYDSEEEWHLANIAAFVVDASTRENICDVFSALTLSFGYIPPKA